MAKTFYPFDAGAGGVVTEAEWETMARLWRTTGVVAGEASELAVSADGIDLTVDVAPGVCWIRGFYFGSDAIETLTIAAADPFDPRIDRIVVRLDRLNNLVDLAVLAGTPAAAPSAPSLTQGAVVWEIELAQVTVPAAATTIAAGNVADGRTIVASPSFVAGGTAPAEATGTTWVRQGDGAYVPIDVATQAELDGHTAATSPHSSTAAATAARLVLRDAAGRAKFADPAAAQDAATKAYLEAQAVLKSLVDAAGDLLVGSADNALARLAKGADGDVLQMVAGSLAWAAPSSSGAQAASGTFIGDGTDNRLIPLSFEPSLVIVETNGDKLFFSHMPTGDVKTRINAGASPNMSTVNAYGPVLVAGGFEVSVVGTGGAINTNSYVSNYVAIG